VCRTDGMEEDGEEGLGMERGRERDGERKGEGWR